MQRRHFVGAIAGAALAARELAAASSVAEPMASEAPFRLSVMLWTVYRDLPFAERLERVHEAGYSAVELVDEFKNWSKDDFLTARRKRRELKIEVDATCGVWHALADANDREPFLKSLENFQPTMKELEATKLILQSGNKVPGISAEQMRDNCIETLKRAGDIAARNDIELLVENIDPEENPKYYLTSSAEGFEIVRTVGNPHVKFLYDFFHEQISDGNLIAKLDKNIEYVGLVHVADVPGRHEPGSGEINYANIFRRLNQLSYRRYAAMEFIPRGDAVQELKRAREMVVESLRLTSTGATSEGNPRRNHASA